MMHRAVLAILTLLVLSGCAGIFSGPPVKHREPNAMKEGPGLFTGDTGELSVEL